MKKKEIKISNELMDALVFKFFNTQIINKERNIKNIEKNIKVELGEIPINSPKNKDIPMFSCTINSIIDINEEDVQEYFDSYNKAITGSGLLCNKLPYFSIVSDNSDNELQVYLNQYDGKVRVEDLSCKTEWYEKINKKYVFIN